MTLLDYCSIYKQHFTIAVGQKGASVNYFISSLLTWPNGSIERSQNKLIHPELFTLKNVSKCVLCCVFLLNRCFTHISAATN